MKTLDDVVIEISAGIGYDIYFTKGHVDKGHFFIKMLEQGIELDSQEQILYAWMRPIGTNNDVNLYEFSEHWKIGFDHAVTLTIVDY